MTKVSAGQTWRRRDGVIGDIVATRCGLLAFVHQVRWRVKGMCYVDHLGFPLDPLAKVPPLDRPLNKEDAYATAH